jgi:hypothetical protein
MRISKTALLLCLVIVPMNFRPRSAGTASAASSAVDPDRVEEDWQLVVANPDPLGVGPQITTCMAPSTDGDSPFVAFDLNYREYPIFQAGGMQVQTWGRGQLISTAAQGTELFNTPGETITWTQSMTVSDGTVLYDIGNGQSTTWGNFGQGSLLSVSFRTDYGSLANYSPDDSQASSGASWQSNNVTSLKLLRVRYYANGQLLQTDTTTRTVIPVPSTN